MKDKILTVAALSLILYGCTLLYPGCRNDPNTIAIMTWNIENLFDDIHNGTEYRDFIPGEETWTAEDFHGKMAALSEAIGKIISGGPDILLLQEVENENVLQIFANDYLGRMNYHWQLFSREEGQAAGTAVLSRLPIETAISHRTEIPGMLPGRPLMEIRVTLGTGNLIIFNNHWKSKSGGAEETEEARRAAAGVLNRRIIDLNVEYGFPSIIIAGDLNEDLHEDEKNNYTYPTALASILNRPRVETTFTEYRPELTLWYAEPKDLKRRLEAFSADGRSSENDKENLPLFVSPWLETDSKKGSYFYRKEWERIDHFLLTPSLFDGFGIEFNDFRLCDEDFLLYADGGPIRWDRDRGEGYSDHLPLLINLKLD